MKKPIADFVKQYIKSDFSRFHMPGHKSSGPLGFEEYDITEVFGADVLSSADGIIKESEQNATALFGSGKTLYSTEGATSVIYTMLSMVKRSGDSGHILAARNVHKSFVHALGLLDLDVRWILPENSDSIISFNLSAKVVQDAISQSPEKPLAMYITSPDYLGNIQPISEIAEVCKKHGVPLLVDNAHGAYLGFLEESLHPIHLGATLCCDSAHKTLPVLTGGAYLHISKDAPTKFFESAKEKLSFFTSTSPSYLILQSLDLCNKYLEDGFSEKLSLCVDKINNLKSYIEGRGFKLLQGEPLKIVIDASSSGYCGDELAEILRKNKIEPEFSDRDYLVLMCSTQNSDKDFSKLQKAFENLYAKKGILRSPFKMTYPVTKLSVRKAMFSDWEEVPAENSVGRVFASATLSCPPAVPVAISGEVITEETIKLFAYYGIKKVSVLKD